MKFIRNRLAKIVSKFSEFCANFACRIRFHEPHEDVMDSWFLEKCDHTLRQEYDLNKNSLVFDLGGYEGQWTSDIFSRYCCSIHVFEPVPIFANNISRRFSKNQNIKVNFFGIGKETSREVIALSYNGSSLYKKNGELIEVDIVKASDYFRTNLIIVVDLMKINIEGEEYNLLDHLIEKQLIPRIRDIQIQFHDFVPNAVERRTVIQQSLQMTHFLTYEYPFVWENWRLKTPDASISGN